MYITIHSDSIGSFFGAILIIVISIYSILYLHYYDNDDRVKNFLFIQISLFIFLFSYSFYISSKDIIYVLLWTKFCYLGVVTSISASVRFFEAISHSKNLIMRRLFDSISIILSILLFLPGNHFFTKILNPSKSHSSVIKGDFFVILVAIILISLSYAIFRLIYHVVKHSEERKLIMPLLIGFIVLFLFGLWDAIFAAILNISTPLMWVGPTSIAISIAYYLTHMAQIKHAEAKVITEEKEIIYKNLIVDKMTGLYTRDYIIENLRQLYFHLKRFEREYSLIFMDIDNFKLINDNLGHEHGDKILEKIGVIINGSSRQNDICARFGGDEFLMLLADCNVNQAKDVVQSIHKRFSLMIKNEYYDWDMNKEITLSSGIVSINSIEENPENIIYKADRAMYESKKSGKNIITII